jgi:hypothetical protein
MANQGRVTIFGFLRLACLPLPLCHSPPFAWHQFVRRLLRHGRGHAKALDQAIAAGGERVEAVQATVHLKRRTKLSL